jgi:hypothetical protein
LTSNNYAEYLFEDLGPNIIFPAKRLVLNFRRALPPAFDPSRWLKDNEDFLSPAAKTAFCAFGAGAFNCLGIHLAYMQMRYAAVFFFRECKGARLAESATAESMEMENYFVVTPKGHRCEIYFEEANRNRGGEEWWGKDGNTTW